MGGPNGSAPRAERQNRLCIKGRGGLSLRDPAAPGRGLIPQYKGGVAKQGKPVGNGGDYWGQEMKKHR